MRIRDLSLGFVLLLLSSSFLHLLTYPNLLPHTAAGESVNIMYVQQEGVIWLHICPFSAGPQGPMCGWDCQEVLPFADMMPMKV